MIAGIYGMNFKNMPELEWVWDTRFARPYGGDRYWLYFQFKNVKWL